MRDNPDNPYNPDNFQGVASFLRGSWIEVPDRTSTSRFMRPRYVVRVPESANNKGSNVDSVDGQKGEGFVAASAIYVSNSPGLHHPWYLTWYARCLFSPFRHTVEIRATARKRESKGVGNPFMKRRRSTIGY